MYLPRLLLGTSSCPASVRLIVVLAALTATAVRGAELQQNGADPRAVSVGAAEAPYSEDQVKAAFLFHFATYAEWPSNGDDGALTFAVLRDSDIADELERFTHDRNIRGRPIRVRRIASVKELQGAEVLFVGSSQNRRLGRVLRSVDGPTLVVTDAPNGIPTGAMINFQVVGHRVRFEIALPAVQQRGLTLSSRLLSAAMRVEMSRCHLECGVDEQQDFTRYASVPARLRKPNPA